MSLDNPYESNLFDVEIEKFLLSSMLLKDGAVIPAVSAILSADDFYRPEHRIIFNTISQLYSKRITPNILTIVDELKKSGNLDKIGTDTVFALPQWAHTTAYSKHYAKLIKDKATARKVHQVAFKISQDTRAGLKATTEIIADATAEFDKISAADENKLIDVKEFVFYRWLKTIEDNQKYADRKTGFSNIDEYQIFRDGLYVLGATPAAGKTTFAWQLADQLAMQGESVIFCSYEMSEVELVSKSFARRLFIDNPYQNLTAAQINKGGWDDSWDDKIYDLREDILNSDINLHILPMQEENIDELITTIRPFCVNVDKAPIVFIDYLQILPPVDREDDKQKIDHALRKMKLFQKNTHTTFIAISSFNRGNYFNSVAYESFKDSGNIEYTADVIWALQLNIVNSFKEAKDISAKRKEVDEAKKQQPRQIQLKCLKNRHGNNYDCYFNYYSAHDYFEPCDESDFEEVEGPPEPINKSADEEYHG